MWHLATAPACAWQDIVSPSETGPAGTVRGSPEAKPWPDHVLLIWTHELEKMPRQPIKLANKGFSVNIRIQQAALGQNEGESGAILTTNLWQRQRLMLFISKIHQLHCPGAWREILYSAMGRLCQTSSGKDKLT